MVSWNPDTCKWHCDIEECARTNSVLNSVIKHQAMAQNDKKTHSAHSIITPLLRQSLPKWNNATAQNGRKRPWAPPAPPFFG